MNRIIQTSRMLYIHRNVTKEMFKCSELHLSDIMMKSIYASPLQHKSIIISIQSKLNRANENHIEK